MHSGLYEGGGPLHSGLQEGESAFAKLPGKVHGQRQRLANPGPRFLAGKFKIDQWSADKVGVQSLIGGWHTVEEG